ncbi:MAG TPA: L-lactate dehydrogenase [Candidatus Ornithospirochaeta avicola]|uniref:L-lactate dehydrogenase n=1 Tax=Candidatus Ornithospirochaeta avicola TaxID=2840896 RepID=A0A9D1PSB1_9SPIO|nr:L-lactate dehydrogenase [Candidatus Ornithospirochaeta avicola]
MLIKRTKVVIAGAGNVGVTTAYSIVNQGLCDELVMIDLNKEKAYGEVLDLSHSISFMNRNIRIKSGSYEDCSDADIVIITASAPMSKSDNDRLLMLDKSMAIIKSIVTEVMESGFDGIFLVVSNPVDIMTYYTYKLSGLPKNQVIGSGTVLDTARLRYYIGQRIDVDQRSVNAYVMGEHGDTEFVSWSTATVGGKSIENVIKDNKDRLGDDPYNKILQETRVGGWEILSRKGNTSYGIAGATTKILKAILQDENHIYPISVYLDGEYGVSDVYISVPTIINRYGAKEIVELKLNEEEKERFLKSVEILKENNRKLVF